MEYLLGDVCDFINGGAWSESEYVEDGIPVVKVSNLKGERIGSENLNYISVESLEKYSKNLLVEGDLIIATVGSHPSLESSAAGRSVITSKENEGFLLNQNAVCIRTKDNNLLDQKYLGYVAKTQLFKNFIQNRGAGAANQMRIPIGAIKSFKINIPVEQKKIAKTLSNYDDLIENNLKRIKLLEETMRLIYEEWFFSFRIEGEELELDSETCLPFGWRKETVESLVDFKSGYSFKSALYEVNKRYKIVTIKNVQDGLFIPKTTDSISMLPTNLQEHQILKSGDIIMSLTGNVGRVCLVYGDSYLLNQRVVNLIPKNKLDYGYLYSLFRHAGMTRQLENISNGAAQQNLSPVNASKIKLTIPTRETRDKFHYIVKPMIDLIIKLNLQNQLLKEARDILLPRLMTSALDIENLKVAV
ncbi:MAG: restriction endonuclease subunit S [Sulfuricurvum sp.]|nr:restriction endonuclease subunit S [Sulfuricurvum sp.]